MRALRHSVRISTDRDSVNFSKSPILGAGDGERKIPTEFYYYFFFFSSFLKLLLFCYIFYIFDIIVVMMY